MTEKTRKTTRAKVPPPPRSRPFLPASKATPSPADNMRDTDLVGMTFNMPRAWHTEFKVTATLHKMSMRELLIEAFAAWQREQARDN